MVLEATWEADIPLNSYPKRDIERKTILDVIVQDGDVQHPDSRKTSLGSKNLSSLPYTLSLEAEKTLVLER